MGIEKKVFKIIAFLFLTVSVANCLTKNIDNKTVECDDKIIKENIFTFYHIAYGFDSLYKFINKRYCNIDSVKLNDYLFQIYSEYKVGQKYSEIDERKFNYVRTYLSTIRPWSNNFRQCTLNEYRYYKSKKNMGFYSWANFLIINANRENEWFTYATDVYNSINKDSINTKYRSERRYIYNSLVKKSESLRSVPEKIKMESMLYAIMQKDIWAFDIVDEYFSEKIPAYQNSIQKRDLSKKLLAIFNNLDEFKTCTYYKYIVKVENEMSKKTNLTNYEPPFKF